ncbi:C4-dicarboxylate ABC transporter substrate-binding protein [Rhodoplanes serenus]|uniref:C4-dicarboxylate ABC transporter substrate-binding protein n=1 Tax=Rhodoplanes serenus TaxID=200615 RepID=A0A9X5ASD2_9BRAD|nr:TAXI family TRAP transporter solute-binding subunit [Rhodoplanes serenus]MTW17312.1 C4-dicarboxylate ABC transporter substrate-binding protein [Rhodoplanes serenus]
MVERPQRPRWRHVCSHVWIAARAPVAAVLAIAITASLVVTIASVVSASAQTLLRTAPEAAPAAAPAAPRLRPRPPVRRPAEAAPSRPTTVSIVSGPIDTTDLAVACDLSAVLDDGDQFRILPFVGKGGGQNVRDLRALPGIDLGIATTTALPRERAEADKLVYIAKLFNEELHILVRADAPFAGVADLADKPVAVGDAQSGTRLVVRDVFARLGVAPVEVAVGPADAVEKLRSGEIAAAVLVSGKPAAALSRLVGREFRLLPVPFAKPLQADFLPASLTAADYPDLIAPGTAVETVAVGTVLFANAWPKGSEGHRRLEQFVERLFPRLAELQKPPRHPKWRETSLSATVPGLARFAPAEAWLRRQAPAASELSRERFDAFLASRRVALDETTTPADRERLFREFLRWNETRERR